VFDAKSTLSPIRPLSRAALVAVFVSACVFCVTGAAGADVITVRDSAGRTITINNSSRIVSIGGAVTEILYALGLEDRIVAVDTTSVYPERALAEKPNVGYMRQLSPEGTVRLKGRDLCAYRPHGLAQHRAVLSQSITVGFPFTVAEIVRMGAGATRSRSTQAFVESALAEVGLATLRDRIITTLSGGEQHRAHLARVLVQLSCGEREHGPGLLLLDEPTANLDLRHQVDFIGLTRLRARCGTAVVAVLHDLNLAAAFADRIIVLHGGAVVADGPARAAITTDMLGRVFDVCAAPGEAPADGMPFVLPQMMTARAGWRTGEVSG
jgi:iron complex transport system ATP-binding protein